MLNMDLFYARWIYIFAIISLTYFIDDVSCVLIRQSPSNITVLAGSDATFSCQVIEKRLTDYVFWKKVTSGGFTDVISYNVNVMNASKYSVDRGYTLNIHDVTLDDETSYECQAGVDRARAQLTVTVMMSNMTLHLGQNPPLLSNSFVNITCIVSHSRPPADIRWLHGQDDITSLASSCSKTSGIDGFGDSTSVINVLVFDNNMPYRCIASLPGIPVARTEVVFPIVDGNTSGAREVCQCVGAIDHSRSTCTRNITSPTWNIQCTQEEH